MISQQNFVNSICYHSIAIDLPILSPSISIEMWRVL